MSKEIQLSLAFCGALAAILLISAPVNETISLCGSGVAFLISSGFFYGGISKHFADKEKPDPYAEQQAELMKAIIDLPNTLHESVRKTLEEIADTLSALSYTINDLKTGTTAIERNTAKIKDFDEIFTKLHTETDNRLKEVIETVDIMSNSVNKPLSEIADALSALSTVANGIKSDTTSIDGNVAKVRSFGELSVRLQNSTSNRLKEMIDNFGAMNDSIVKPLNEIIDALSTMSYVVSSIKTGTTAIERNTAKIKDLDEKFIQLHNATDNRLKEVIETVDALNDSVGKPLDNVSDTLSTMIDIVSNIRSEADEIKTHTGKLKDLNRTVKSILDDVSDSSQNADKTAKVIESLQELMQVIKRQEEIYQTVLHQYKEMSTKDIALIENLARKLR